MAGANGGSGAGFGGHLAGTGRSMLADARHALADPSLTDAERVHELRKAFKRSRPSRATPLSRGAASTGSSPSRTTTARGSAAGA